MKETPVPMTAASRMGVSALAAKRAEASAQQRRPASYASTTTAEVYEGKPDWQGL